jgi:hypothetical protein
VSCKTCCLQAITSFESFSFELGLLLNKTQCGARTQRDAATSSRSVQGRARTSVSACARSPARQSNNESPLAMAALGRDARCDAFHRDELASVVVCLSEFVAELRSRGLKQEVMLPRESPETHKLKSSRIYRVVHHSV